VTDIRGGEGTSTVRMDQPSAADDLADRAALPDRTGDRDELRQRLGRLPPGHPSSPAETDGTPRPPQLGLRCRDSPYVNSADDADWRPLTDAEYAEHVTKVRDLLDKARADGLTTDRQHTIDPAREVWSGERETLQDSIIEDCTGRHLACPASGGQSWPEGSPAPESPRSWKARPASSGRST
jgi:hypothetical protein